MAGIVEGVVVNITPQGDLTTDITDEQLRHAPRDESVQIACGEHVTYGLFPYEHAQPAMTFLARFDPHGVLELTIVDDNASLMLDVRRGEKVVVSW